MIIGEEKERKGQERKEDTLPYWLLLASSPCLPP